MKKLLRLILWAMSFVAVSPLILAARIGMDILKTEVFYEFGSQSVSLIPGIIGLYFRSAFYRLTLAEFYLNGHVMFGALISHPQTKIGHHFIIGVYANIGYAHIGNNVAIANKVSVLAGRRQHNFDDPEKPIMGATGRFDCVTIGDNVFIGEQSVVMANIGERSIIGAGSVVIKDIQPFSVAVGNPAKVIKSRKV